jgi:hypothetical protein
MTKIVLFCLFLVCYSPGISADIIYQWSDEWGQLQYSKEPVPGAMISDLTELPEAQETTEQQKQEAMFMKIQEMRQADFLRKRKKLIEDDLKLQQLNVQNYCAQLRNMLMDIQLSNARQLALLGHHLLAPNNYYVLLENDISREIRRNCR